MPGMAKKTARKKSAKPAGPPVAVVAAKGVFAVALAAGLIAAVGWVGRKAGGALADRDRYAVRVADLRFATPPYIDPKAFLTEVRYLGNLPETVQSIDPKLSEQLAAAFRKHPWVADVTGVTVAADSTVTVGLTLRAPVLAVRWRNGRELEVRAVDAAGVLLPADAPTDGLAVLVNERTGPKPEVGRVWPERDVPRAAELVTRNPAKLIERTATGWKITEPSGQVFALTTP
jgi:hypothetical protein